MVIKIICVCVFSVIVIMLIKNITPSIAPMIAICAGVLAFYISVPYIKDIIAMISDFVRKTKGVGDGIKIVIKALGISILCEFASQICSDAGENYLAYKIEFAGKIAIMCMTAPELLSLINLIIGLITAV